MISSKYLFERAISSISYYLILLHVLFGSFLNWPEKRFFYVLIEIPGTIFEVLLHGQLRHYLITTTDILWMESNPIRLSLKGFHIYFYILDFIRGNYNFLTTQVKKRKFLTVFPHVQVKFLSILKPKIVIYCSTALIHGHLFNIKDIFFAAIILFSGKN